MTQDTPTIEELVAALQREYSPDLAAELWQGIQKYIRQRAGKFLRQYRDIIPPGTEIGDLENECFLMLPKAIETHNGEHAFLTWFTFYMAKAFANAADMRRTYQRSMTTSADDVIPGTEDTIILDTLPAHGDPLQAVDDAIFTEQLHAELDRLIDTLPPKEAEVIRANYFQGKTLAEVGAAAGVSTSYAGQLHRDGISHLRRKARSTQGEALRRMAAEIVNPYTRSAEAVVLERETVKARLMDEKRRLQQLMNQLEQTTPPHESDR